MLHFKPSSNAHFLLDSWRDQIVWSWWGAFGNDLSEGSSQIHHRVSQNITQ